MLDNNQRNPKNCHYVSKLDEAWTPERLCLSYEIFQQHIINRSVHTKGIKVFGMFLLDLSQKLVS